MEKVKVEDKLAQLTETIVEAMQDKKARDIVSLDLRNLDNRVVDKFIICSGDTDRQVDAIAQAVEEYVRKELKEKPWHREGYENKEWILLDYVNVVVHIFVQEKREFYAIEELWGDAEVERFKNFA
jgi:ribosome-associated protein